MQKMLIILSGIFLISIQFVHLSLASEIKSLKVIKVGPAAIAENKAKSMANDLLRTIPYSQQNPYEVQRPVIIRATYRCSPKQKWSILDIETIQTKDKWGKWVANNNALKDVIHGKCGEETLGEIELRKWSEEENRKKAEQQKHQEIYDAREKERKENEELKQIEDYNWIILKDNTVFDRRTNLMWASTELKKGISMTWPSSKRFCEQCKNLGLEGWRLPTQKEVVMLYNNVERYKGAEKYFSFREDVWINEDHTSCSPFNGELKQKFDPPGISGLHSRQAWPVRSVTDEEASKYYYSHLFNNAISSSTHGKNSLAKKLCDKILEGGYVNDKRYVSYVYRLRGIILEELGDKSNAIKDLDKAIQIDPKNEIHYDARGAFYFHQGDDRNAIKDLDKAIEINSKNEFAYVTRVKAYYRQGDYSSAIKDCNNLIAINPRNILAYNLRATLYGKLRDYNSAIKDLNKAIEINPQDATVYYEFACIFSLKGDELKACKYLNRAIEEGFKDWVHIKNDSDFNTIRNSTCYRDIMAGK